MMRTDFAAFILSHGRADRVYTYRTLRKSGYTGRIVILVDDLDPTIAEYKTAFGDEVYVFDKKAIGRTFDRGDNFENYRSTNYARNASFAIARELGIKYFVQLDDDYTSFRFRFNDKFEYGPSQCNKLDQVFSAVLEFLVNTNVASVALSQGGDFIGGTGSSYAHHIKTKRKCMNSFFCSTDRQFPFVGRLNEDVNTYVRHGSVGLIFLTIYQFCLEQLQTQKQSGGMTEAYLESGTYVKSFYSVMYQPSSVKVRPLRDRGSWRLHHMVSWKHTVPMILRETVKKKGDGEPAAL
jgi:hypothetical protein